MTGQKARTDISNLPDPKRGLLLEPIARAELAKLLEKPIRHHNQEEHVIATDFPWAHATPDGWVEDDASPKQGVELKVPRPENWYKITKSGLPEIWIVQVQHTLMILHGEIHHVGILNPVTMEMTHIPVHRDDELIRLLAKKEQEFMQHVENGTPPGETSTPESWTTTQAGLVLLNSPAIIEAGQVLRATSDRLAKAEAEWEVRKSEFLALSQGADKWTVPGIGKFNNALCAGRRSFDSKAAVEKFPELKEDKFWKVGTPFRSFRPTWQE